ncbi:uncharacterized protein LOC9662219 [Selaginella moellendorffii]|uniref:uncharacterized protein LOC9662219 n=1 Tax=Selaginella moellendorffii TaxID=88036 RepID=UPI000D1CA371|nr:uncharacterized protein LOC9662219 [Selaginella moellendorffii]|eukprot:XP_024517248.1 uncharacterized protein LOC9662219 [Selaginella moellendorffii]
MIRGLCRSRQLLRLRCQARGMAAATPVEVKSPVRPVRVLFCGPESVFPDGFRWTKKYLEPHSQIEVDAVPCQEIPKVFHEYDMCVARMVKVDSSLISLAKRMQLICQFGVGLEGVDVEAATKAGIKVGRIASDATGNALSCAEHAIYLMLALLRDQKGMDKSVSEKCLGFPTGDTLFGKTVFIVGYGNIGKELAIRLRAFGVRVLATKRSWSKKNSSLHPEDNPLLADGLITRKSHQLFQYLKENEDLLVDEKGSGDSLYDFASRADIIVLCCLLTPETAGMVNEKFVNSMKKGALVVNVARGGLLDYKSVRDGLESGHLGGLGLDVAWHEPYDPQDPILQHPKVILTPHVAGVTQLSYAKMAQVIADCAVELSHGRGVSGLLELVN